MSCLSEAALAVVLAGGFLAPELPANVVYVIDGDTLIADIALCDGKWREMHVRLRGLDAPEMEGNCSDERHKARLARARLQRLAGKQVLLDRFGRDKYGRLLVRVRTPQGEDIAGRLIREGLARPYAGGRRRPWC